LKKYLLRTPAVLLTILIFVVSSFPLKQVDLHSELGIDKLIHIVEYAVYSISISTALITFPDTILRRKLYLFTIIISMVYAASDEIHQAFVMGRNCSWLDFIANAIGIILGAYLFKKWNLVKRIGV